MTYRSLPFTGKWEKVREGTYSKKVDKSKTLDKGSGMARNRSFIAIVMVNQAEQKSDTT